MESDNDLTLTIVAKHTVYTEPNDKAGNSLE